MRLPHLWERIVGFRVTVHMTEDYFLSGNYPNWAGSNRGAKLRGIITTQQSQPATLQFSVYV